VGSDRKTGKGVLLMKVLATGNDQLVVDWTFDRFGIYCTKIDMAFAIIEDGEIVGSCFFQAHNGPDIELSYYGRPNTMTPAIVKQLAKIAVDHFGVSRITARTMKSNKALKKSIHKIGFVYEGIRHRAFGEEDAVMYGLFGENLARLAGKVMQ
jgi:RimJ/RimL family protein N-acetyltransferase